MIKELEASEYGLWDGFVADSPQGTLFHTFNWLSASGDNFRIYGYFKGEELLAGFPIVYKSKLNLKVACHPPLTPYLGIVFKGNESKYVTKISNEKEISRAIAIKLKSDFDMINFNFMPLYTDLQSFIWEKFDTKIRYTYLLELDDLDKVWNRMDAKRRNDIIRTEKDGIHVEICNDFHQAFDLIEKTFKRQNMEPTFKSTAFRYNDLLSQKNQCNTFLSIDSDGNQIAMVYIVWDNKRSYYLLGGYDNEKGHHGASALAMWEAIKFTKNQLGLNQFDFEGSMIEPVEMFFRKFGGKLTPYYTVKWAKPSVKAVLYVKRVIGTGLRKFRLR